MVNKVDQNDSCLAIELNGNSKHYSWRLNEFKINNVKQ